MIEQQISHWIRTGHVPKSADFGPEFQDDWRLVRRIDVDLYRSRWSVIRKFGFALPCREAVDALKGLSPLVEVGAGTGAWSRLLAKNGADIVATDKSFATGYRFSAGRFHPVQRLSAENAIRRYPERNVLMIWPCYSAEWPTKAVREIRHGRHLALISEGNGGCCGADSLFRHLDKYFRHIETVHIPCWHGMHDRLDIYRRAIGAVPHPDDRSELS